MPTIKFVDAVIRNLKPTDKRQIFWCDRDPGFGLRMTPSGTKTFVYKYMIGRKSRWVTLGKYPKLTVRKARAKYIELYEQVRDYGRDPIAEIQEEKQAQKSRLTVSDLIAVYLDIGKQKGKTDLHRERMSLDRDVVPVIGKKFIDEVTPNDIEDIQKIILGRAKAKNKKNSNYARQGGKGAVYHTLAYTRQLFNLALKRGLIESNPVEAIENLGSIQVRERVLNFEEIWLFWNKIEHVGLPTVTANALKFILATMQRGNEVRHMKYAAYKESELVWQMTVQDTKNRTMHRVPLNRYAQEVLKAVKPYTMSSDYVFGATRALKPPEVPSGNLVPLGETALSQAIRKKREALGIDDFSPHDLRRTAATWLTGIGLPELYAKLMLNHKESKSNTTSQVYVQYSYDFEKRRAVDIWEFVLDQIVSCDAPKDIPTLDELREYVRSSGLL